MIETTVLLYVTLIGTLLWGVFRPSRAAASLLRILFFLVLVWCGAAICLYLGTLAVNHLTESISVN